MKLKSILVAGLLAISIGSAVAQGFPGGGRGGMRMMGGGAMALSNPSFLLQRDDVRNDLALDDDQKAKLGDMQQTMMQEMGPMFIQMRDATPEQRAKLMEQISEKAKTEVAKILKPTQVSRLKEIAIQLAGNEAVTNKDIAKELAITPAQKTKIDDLVKLSGEARRALGEKARNGEIQWQEMGPIMEKNTKILNDEIAKILTDVQKTKLKALGGKTFTPDPPPGG